MATDVEGDWDGQDQSEIFDEDNQNEDEAGGPGNELRTFEELPEVLDVTSAVGDADDDEALIAEELDDDDIIRLESDAELADFEDDDPDTRDEADDDEPDEAGELSMSRAPDDNVDLEFTGDLDSLPATEADSAAAMEADDLDDDDLEDLGYPGEDEPAQHGEAAEEQRRR